MSRYNLLALMTLAIICAVSAQIFNPPQHNCSTHESYSACGTLCEPSCNDRNPTNNVICRFVVCIRPLTGGCRCDTGFVRHGGCIPPANCPVIE